MPATGDLACNPGVCPDWELNWWPLASQAGIQSTEPHQPGLRTLSFLWAWYMLKTWLSWVMGERIAPELCLAFCVKSKFWGLGGEACIFFIVLCNSETELCLETPSPGFHFTDKDLERLLQRWSRRRAVSYWLLIFYQTHEIIHPVYHFNENFNPASSNWATWPGPCTFLWFCSQSCCWEHLLRRRDNPPSAAGHQWRWQGAGLQAM